MDRFPVLSDPCVMATRVKTERSVYKLLEFTSQVKRAWSRCGYEEVPKAWVHLFERSRLRSDAHARQ